MDIEEQDFSQLDRYIKRHAGLKSARQIAELTGFTPDEVIRRRNTLVDAIDELSIQAQMSFILAELQDTAREYRAKADLIDPNNAETGRNIGPIITASIQAQKAAMQQLQNIQKQNQGTVDTLNMRRQEELLSLIRETIYTSISVISERHDLPYDELMTVFQENLQRAADRRDLEA